MKFIAKKVMEITSFFLVLRYSLFIRGMVNQGSYDTWSGKLEWKTHQLSQQCIIWSIKLQKHKWSELTNTDRVQNSDFTSIRCQMWISVHTSTILIFLYDFRHVPGRCLQGSHAASFHILVHQLQTSHHLPLHKRCRWRALQNKPKFMWVW